jgi:uncharacterized Zn finger protein (UPF0148 family)
MQIHKILIYHCLACGAILHREPGEAVPLCCGKQMLNAAAETVTIPDQRESETGAGHSHGNKEPSSPAGKPR